MKTGGTRLVIVGGGTAGWIAALMLQRHAAKNELQLEISVVESSRIPTIGVGEGTTAVFRQALHDLGVDETEFVRETGATIKFGIRHRDWKRKGHSYDGPIDDPNLLALCRDFMPGEQQSMLHIQAVSSGTRVSDIHLFGELMQRQKSPFGLEDDHELIPAGPFQHAFHFDQARVGAYLRRITQGVERVDAEVAELKRNGETGDIEALVMTDGSELAGDFFIDCTGFRRKLIGEGMGAKWISYREHLPVNRAMPFWLDHEEGCDVSPFTLAWAQQAGWMWSIPTQDRIGCGYVYSDEFIGPEEAQAEIERVLGRPIEPRADLRFDSGRLDRAWIGNCLALGLSSSFLEPLEATSIHGTVVQIQLFTKFFLGGACAATEGMRDKYNAVVARQLNDFRIFINLHYVGQREEPFWRHVREDCLHETTRDMLDHWASHMPRRSDFTPFPGDLAHINEQLYYPVLDGLGHLSREAARCEMAANPKLRAYARKTIDAHVRDYKKAATKCIGHKTYLDLVADGAVTFQWH
ncbi:tryptophan halogenase family protein [Nitratireductor mangrovi]|nr:tryptophan halogenase family protein [Nitratireductor mangrovi]